MFLIYIVPALHSASLYDFKSLFRTKGYTLTRLNNFYLAQTKLNLPTGLESERI